MSNTIVSDRSMSTAQRALEGLNQRVEAISQNMANVDTPGYQAVQVNFENALQQQINGAGSLGLATASPRHLQSAAASSQSVTTSLRTGGSERADGNDVDINVELAQMTETGVRYETLLQLVSNKLSLLKTIASGR